MSSPDEYPNIPSKFIIGGVSVLFMNRKMASELEYIFMPKNETTNKEAITMTTTIFNENVCSVEAIPVSINDGTLDCGAVCPMVVYALIGNDLATDEVFRTGSI
jgi:hypothetical protein